MYALEPDKTHSDLKKSVAKIRRNREGNAISALDSLNYKNADLLIILQQTNSVQKK